MSNFIGMVFATLKKEGVDTSGMDVNDAIAKYNEIKGADGGQDAKGEETPKATEKTAETGKEPAKADKDEEPKANEDGPKKVDASELYDNSKKDKFGNPMLSQKYHDIAKQAGQDYIDSMTKYDSMDKLIQSNVFPGYLSEKICEGLNDATNDIPDITETEIENIISELTGYKFNYDAYERGRGGYTTYFSKQSNNNQDASKLQQSMGVTPDEAKAFVSGKGSLSGGGSYQGISNVKDAPKFEYKSQTGYEKGAKFTNPAGVQFEVVDTSLNKQGVEYVKLKDKDGEFEIEKEQLDRLGWLQQFKK